ncbi:hypothetical protein U1Q18_037337 [Sarracenia purpurea var. burkii]
MVLLFFYCFWPCRLQLGVSEGHYCSRGSLAFGLDAASLQSLFVAISVVFLLSGYDFALGLLALPLSIILGANRSSFGSLFSGALELLFDLGALISLAFVASQWCLVLCLVCFLAPDYVLISIAVLFLQ